MGYIIDFIKKILGFKYVVTGLLLSFQITFYTSLVIFTVYLTMTLFNIYKLIKQLLNFSTSGVLAGSDINNDFNAVAWTMLESYGILEVFRAFLPLIFSVLTIYLSMFATRMLLDFKAKALASMHRAARLFIG